MPHGDRSIAYFSMEIGLENMMPTYSGGLGVLAGDTIRSAADLAVPMVALTLLHGKGFFFQTISDGRQGEAPVAWAVSDFLVEMPQRVRVDVEGRKVALRAWRYDASGFTGASVPVYFLDADLEENAPADRTLTHFLYGGDQRYRLCQEILLGIGGVRMLRALGYTRLSRFHMNEGHASLLALELLDEQLRRTGGGRIGAEELDAVRRLCVFTTHTPVAAGFDQFPMALVDRVLARPEIRELKEVFRYDEVLNMTYLGLSLSRFINGVAKKHGEVSRLMFSQYHVDSITNGVHATRWTAPPVQELFDRHIPDWRQDNFSLRHALAIPRQELWQAHLAAKKALLDRVNGRSNAGLKDEVFTIGFARRAAEYKRADLFFHDLDRLKRIDAGAGPFQAVFAGKAHPADQGGKEIIRRLIEAMGRLKGAVACVYLENYDMDLGRLMTSGCDLWLNTPQPPLEASGTSGMKAALNGVPSLSVKDGWWVEGHIEGVTGWSVGDEPHDTAQDAASMYRKLEETILPLYYGRRDGYIEVMRHAVALNGSFFNTQRMMQEYVVKAYIPNWKLEPRIAPKPVEA